MANPFKNELKSGSGNPAPKYGSDVKNPQFDKRTSQAFSCGDDYGVGKRTPVGSEQQKEKYSIPLGCKCFSPDDVL